MFATSREDTHEVTDKFELLSSAMKNGWKEKPASLCLVPHLIKSVCSFAITEMLLDLGFHSFFWLVSVDLACTATLAVCPPSLSYIWWSQSSWQTGYDPSLSLHSGWPHSVPINIKSPPCVCGFSAGLQIQLPHSDGPTGCKFDLGFTNEDKSKKNPTVTRCYCQNIFSALWVSLSVPDCPSLSKSAGAIFTKSPRFSVWGLITVTAVARWRQHSHQHRLDRKIIPWMSLLDVFWCLCSLRMKSDCRKYPLTGSSMYIMCSTLHVHVKAHAESKQSSCLNIPALMENTHTHTGTFAKAHEERQQNQTLHSFQLHRLLARTPAC